jgi:hypothetical protein
MPTEFNGQNGGKLKQSTKIAVTGCTASGARHASRVHAAAKRKHHKKHQKHHKRKARKARRARARGARRGNAHAGRKWGK